MTSDVIQQMREWIAECDWPDLEPEELAELSDEEVIAGVERHYHGGVEQFCRDCWTLV